MSNDKFQDTPLANLSKPALEKTVHEVIESMKKFEDAVSTNVYFSMKYPLASLGEAGDKLLGALFSGHADHREKTASKKNGSKTKVEKSR